MALLKTLETSFTKLSQREKVFLLVGGGFAVVVVLYLLLIEPAWNRSAELSRLIPKKQEELRRLKMLTEEYQSLSARISGLKNQLQEGKTFSPLSYLEEIASQNQVRENIAYIRPMMPVIQEPYQEIPMEVKMENIPLDRLVPFLKTIEEATHFLRIKRLEIRTQVSDSKKLDVTFVVASYETI